MKLFVGRVISAGLLVTAAAATAQAGPRQPLPDQIDVPPSYSTVSDFGGPYAAMAPDAVGPHAPVPLLLPREVYMIVRESGFFPLGLPRQRGLTYSVAVIDGEGDDGHLLVDARNGRIIRFVPAFRVGDSSDDEIAPDVPRMARPRADISMARPRADMPMARPPAPLPRSQAAMPPSVASPPSLAASTPPSPAGSPRPMASTPRRMANQSAAPQPKPAPTPPRTVAEPNPSSTPLAAAPAAAAPPQPSAMVQPRSNEGVTTGQATAKPSARILPTQELPPAQGLDY
jgi:hypothetical protein